jgi:hypothetical protein
MLVPAVANGQAQHAPGGAHQPGQIVCQQRCRGCLRRNAGAVQYLAGVDVAIPAMSSWRNSNAFTGVPRFRKIPCK